MGPSSPRTRYANHRRRDHSAKKVDEGKRWEGSDFKRKDYTTARPATDLCVMYHCRLVVRMTLLTSVHCLALEPGGDRTDSDVDWATESKGGPDHIDDGCGK